MVPDWTASWGRAVPSRPALLTTLLRTFALMAALSSMAAAQKITAELKQRVQASGTAPVFVTLVNQPQAAIVREIEDEEQPEVRIADEEYDRLSAAPLLLRQRLKEAVEESERHILKARRRIAQRITQAVEAEQGGVEQLLTRLSATNIRRFWVLNMLRADVPAAALQELAADPRIAQISLIGTTSAQLNISVSSLGAPAFRSNGITGAGRQIAILDTGIASGHPAFSENGSSIIDKSHVEFTGFLNSQNRTCFFDNPDVAEDLTGHGTLVAAIAAGRGQPGNNNWPEGVSAARLVNLKVSPNVANWRPGCHDARPSASDDDVVAAIEWALANTSAKIFNFSSGGKSDADYDSIARHLDDMADIHGLTIVAASGNQGERVNSPGLGYNIISVGSIDDRNTPQRSDDIAAPDTAVGPTACMRLKPDLAAPGVNIRSANYLGLPLYVSKSGTSMAAPHVAGAVALLSSEGVTDPMAQKAILINSADPLGNDPQWNNTTGWGYVNLETAFWASTPVHYKVAKNKLAPAGLPGSIVFYRIPYSIYRPMSDYRATLVWNRHQNLLDSPLPGPGECGYITREVSSLEVTAHNPSTGERLPDAGPPSVVGINTLPNVRRVRAWTTGDDIILAVKNTAALPRGVARESYALASSAPGLVETTGPRLQASCTPPFGQTMRGSAVSPGNGYQLTCTVSNTGNLTARDAILEVVDARGEVVKTTEIGILPPGVSRQVASDPVPFFAVHAGQPDQYGRYRVTARVKSPSFGGISGETTFLVHQCAPYVSITPPSYSFGGSGTDASFDVTAPAWCEWRAWVTYGPDGPGAPGSAQDFVTVRPAEWSNPPENRIGSGKVHFRVGANTTANIGVFRSANLSVVATRDGGAAPNDTLAVFTVHQVAGIPVFGAFGRVASPAGAGVPGVTIGFKRTAGSGRIPAAVQTDSTGTWKQNDFVIGTTYQAIAAKPGYNMSPAFYWMTSNANAGGLTFTARPTFKVSGRVTSGVSSGASAVQIRFSKVSGTGPTPAAVLTDSDGLFSQDGFVSGTVYRVTPVKRCRIFTLPSRDVSSAMVIFFTDAGDGYTASGRVTRPDGSPVSGAIISFAAAAGPGPAPDSVVTNAAGQWSQCGFRTDTTYLASPRLAEAVPGVSFAPASATIQQAGSQFNFTLSSVSRPTPRPYAESSQ